MKIRTLKTLMNKLHLLTISVFGLFIASCTTEHRSGIEKIIVDEAFIASKTTGSDSSFTENIGPNNITYTTYFLQNSLRVLVVKDSLDRIASWWLMDRHDRTLEGAEVATSTGQILGKLSRENNKIHGPAVYYYDDGRIRSTGTFNKGRPTGEWHNYDENGYLTSIEKYDENGNRIKESK